MNLGVYWYFGFPEGLYNFEYFTFQKGNGGHTDNPAELITNVIIQNPDDLIDKIKSLIDQHKEGFLFIYRDNNRLQIVTGGYQLFDYDFLLAKEVELLLKNENAELTNNSKFETNQLVKFSGANKKDQNLPTKKYLQVVGSNLKKANAETMSLRLDCCLNFKDKKDFINKLSEIAKSVNINVFYYYDFDFSDKSNLMLFFTNGRQGLDLQPKQNVDLISFEEKLEKLFIEYQVKLGYERGDNIYPKNGPNIELIVDKEYIL